MVDQGKDNFLEKLMENSDRLDAERFYTATPKIGAIRLTCS